MCKKIRSRTLGEKPLQLAQPIASASTANYSTVITTNHHTPTCLTIQTIQTLKAMKMVWMAEISHFNVY